MQLHHLNALSNNSSLPHFLHLFPSFSSFSLLLQFLCPLLFFLPSNQAFCHQTLIKVSIVATYKQLFFHNFSKSFSLLCILQKGPFFGNKLSPKADLNTHLLLASYRLQQSPSTGKCRKTPGSWRFCIRWLYHSRNFRSLFSPHQNVHTVTNFFFKNSHFFLVHLAG